MADKLKPCPFCGATRVKLVTKSLYEQGWLRPFVECQYCGANADDLHWNARTDAARIEALEAAARDFDEKVSRDIPVGPEFAQWATEAREARSRLRALLEEQGND